MDGLRFFGNVVAVLEGPDGRRRTAWVGNNLVTLVPRSGLAAWLTGSGFSPPSHIALGSGTASASTLSASALQFEMARTALGTNELFGGLTARYVANFNTQQGNGTISEIGLLNAAAGGALFAIASANIVKTSAYTLSVTWALAVSTGSALATESPGTGFSHLSASGNGTGAVVTGHGAVDGSLYYWNSGLGGSAIFDVIRRSEVAAPWLIYATVTATHLASGHVALPVVARYWVTRATVYSGGGNTGMINTYLEFV